MSTKSRQNLRAYFESRVAKFCDVLVCKSNSQKGRTSIFSSFKANWDWERNGLPSAVALIRSSRPLRTCISAPNTWRQNKWFVLSSRFVKKHSRIKKLAEGTVPTEFNQYTVPSNPSQREKKIKWAEKTKFDRSQQRSISPKIWRVSTERNWDVRQNRDQISR